MQRPQTHWARSGDLRIAYQVIGDGPVDVVAVPGWVSHVEWCWEEPSFARFLEQIGSFARLVIFDKRGTGLSDPVPLDRLPTLEERMDDTRAVMDAVGLERAAVLGISEGGAMGVLFAATYPHRTTALITYGTFTHWVSEPGFPWAPSRAEHERAMAVYEEKWGRPLGLKVFAPSMADDPRFREWWGQYLRLAASPGSALTLYRMNIEVDTRGVLPSVRVPTLILHRSGDLLISVEQGRYMAARIPGARLVELPGADHLPWVGDSEALVGEIQEFLTGDRDRPELERVLSTVLFVDVVASTELAATLGDRRYGDLLVGFYAAVRKELGRFRGRELDTAGDGFLACFDGPARAIRCAWSIREAAAALGLRLRCGLHTGECEIVGAKLGGIAVHTGARVAAAAAPGEVLVSGTVKDLVAGSGIAFEDRGPHRLKGVPGETTLYAATA